MKELKSDINGRVFKKIDGEMQGSYMAKPIIFGVVKENDPNTTVYSFVDHYRPDGDVVRRLELSSKNPYFFEKQNIVERLRVRGIADYVYETELKGDK